MYLFGKITVNPEIPERIKKLEDLAFNLWWSWNTDALKLYKSIDEDLWSKVKNNPVAFMKQVSQAKLYEAANNTQYLEEFDRIINRFETYLNEPNTWFNNTYKDAGDISIAYFSAEYGLDEALPIYSGGLGILSGDHCKSASDLGLPFTAIGLLYHQGYFTQQINRDGWQETSFYDLSLSELPIKPVLDNNNNELIISIDFPGRLIYAKVWQISVGRIKLYMMDTNIAQNSLADRDITARLYGGDQEMRIMQEIFLGIGGCRILESLNVKPTVYHMNEGHSSFLVVEIMRMLIRDYSVPFNVAKEIASRRTIFTTHTPVPAGNDIFPLNLIDKYFSNYWGQLGISRHEFVDLGLIAGSDAPQMFNMGVLALKIAGKKNGVSELHGQVSRDIFSDVWPNVPQEEIPIGHVTNGVHTFTWLSPNLKGLYTKYFDPNWTNDVTNYEYWNGVYNIPDDELWAEHKHEKEKLIDLIKNSLKTQKERNGASAQEIKEIDSILNPDYLTIGFARRFATYKRADLIFKDLEHIKNIINNSTKPVQIIFAGKAHPADRPAHEVIKNIYDISNTPELKGKVILIENYNMSIARHLLHGVDVWMNNPRKPLEASGTSGEKAGVNGVINFSILDGWWVEGYKGNNGWAIGEDKFYDNFENQDIDDSQSMYSILEKQIIPLYYDRNTNNIPVNWIQKMKESIKSVGSEYNTGRMVKDYTNKMYMPQAYRTKQIFADNFKAMYNLAEYKNYIDQNWNNVYISSWIDDSHPSEHTVSVKDSIDVSCFAYLGSINPEHISVEIFYGKVGEDGILHNPDVIPMTLVGKSHENYEYKGNIKIDNGGHYGYTFRVIPTHPEFINKHDLGLIKWVVKKD